MAPSQSFFLSDISPLFAAGSFTPKVEIWNRIPGKEQLYKLNPFCIFLTKKSHKQRKLSLKRTFQHEFHREISDYFQSLISFDQLILKAVSLDPHQILQVFDFAAIAALDSHSKSAETIHGGPQSWKVSDLFRNQNSPQRNIVDCDLRMFYLEKPSLLSKPAREDIAEN